MAKTATLFCSALASSNWLCLVETYRLRVSPSYSGGTIDRSPIAKDLLAIPIEYLPECMHAVQILLLTPPYRLELKTHW